MLGFSSLFGGAAVSRAPLRQCLRRSRWQASAQKPERAARRHLAQPAASAGTETTENALCDLLDHTIERRFVLVGGKGGVGKTTVSASIALRLAEEGFRTLVLSTDPAHSLGDSLEMDLSSGQITRVTDEYPLFALELDTASAVDEFRQLVGAMRSKTDTVSERLGLNELGDLLDTLPPGADEFIALTKVMGFAQQNGDDPTFDRIIIDTAPTGHTLRFLSFPDFLSNFLQKAATLRSRLDSLKSLFPGLANDNDVENIVQRMNIFRERLSAVADLFRDPSQSEFVVVTIPTVLAVKESVRLLESLKDEGIWVRNVIVNQVLSSRADEDSFQSRLLRSQSQWIKYVEQKFDDAYVHKLPQLDTEVRGVFGLRALSTVGFQGDKSWSDVFAPPATVGSTDTRFVFVGGKGGVGKTTTSSALALRLSDEGRRTLVISTDPAHSLGDAFNLELTGRGPVEVVETNGMLACLEVDTASAVEEFRNVVQSFAKKGTGSIAADLVRKFGLDEFSDILDNTPPGTDELVALTKVIDVVRLGKFECVVVDTAPTGHTLRLLSFPDFLNGFLGNVVKLKKRLDAAIRSVTSLVGGAGIDRELEVAEARLGKFRESLNELRSIFRSTDRTQFCIVTIPTAMSVVESERLYKSLKSMQIAVPHIVINQVWPEDRAESFVRRRSQEQEACLQELRRGTADQERERVVGVVPFFDVEVRGVYGLRAVGRVIFSES